MTPLLIAGGLLLWCGVGLLGWLANRASLGPVWLLAALPLGPLFPPLTGWLRLRDDTTVSARSGRRLPTDEDLLFGAPVFSREIRDLKRQGRLNDAADILIVITDELEHRARRQGAALPHWHFEQLADVYRRLGKDRLERRTLKRYLAHPSQKESARRRLRGRLDELTGAAGT